MNKNHPEVEATFQCFCFEKFHTKFYLQKHKKEKHLASFKCLQEDCDRMFYTEYKMKVHYQVKHTDIRKDRGEFPCGICDKVFKYQRYLTDHRKLHSENRPIYECNYCGKKFKSNPAYTSHLVTHEKPEPDILCDKCDKKFYFLSQLKHHIFMVHEDTKYACDFCGKKIRTRESLKNHIKVNHDEGEPDVPCKLCPMKFRTKLQLKLHNEIRHEEKISCKFCDKLLSSKGCLSVHMRMVHKKLKYPCFYDGCEQTYVQRQLLRKHLKKHATSPEDLKELYELSKKVMPVPVQE
jgi:KRAB domain-containing zinc finger protein